MKASVKLCLALVIGCSLLFIGCGEPKTEQGELQMDVRVTEAPAVQDAPVEIIVAATGEPIAAAPETTPEPIVETQTYADALYTAFAGTGALNAFAPYSETDMLDYYGIDVAACKSVVAYTDTEGYCCELVIAEADETVAVEIEALLSGHLDSRYAQFESYDADAAQLVKDAVLRRDGGIVLMIVAPQAEELLSIYRSFEF